MIFYDVHSEISGCDGFVEHFERMGREWPGKGVEVKQASAAADCLLIGRWRMTGADLWDRDHLDLLEPAMMVIDADGHGEIAFGALQAGPDLGYSQSIVHFTWT